MGGTKMEKTKQVQGITTIITLENPIVPWVESFLLDRKAQNVTAGTLYFYRVKLKLFVNYCDSQVIDKIEQITPDTIRQFLLHLTNTGHNPGGVHTFYRMLKTFLYWWEAETEPENWKNPFRKVKAPKVPFQVIEPVALETVQALIEACKGNEFTAVRDKALFYFLLDTGARASEACSVELADIDPISGDVLIRQGKGRKPRSVFLGQKARRSLRNYLKHRPQGHHALWLTDDGEQLSYWTLDGIVRRRSKAAKVKKPGLHDFRRAFALNCLRSGMNVYSLQRLMGHADLQVLRRYLAQTNDDLREAHRLHSPVDMWKF
jgi:site-specific recombinase XerD